MVFNLLYYTYIGIGKIKYVFSIYKVNLWCQCKRNEFNSHISILFLVWYTYFKRIRYKMSFFTLKPLPSFILQLGRLTRFLAALSILDQMYVDHLKLPPIFAYPHFCLKCVFCRLGKVQFPMSHPSGAQIRYKFNK